MSHAIGHTIFIFNPLRFLKFFSLYIRFYSKIKEYFFLNKFVIEVCLRNKIMNKF